MHREVPRRCTRASTSTALESLPSPSRSRRRNSRPMARGRYDAQAAEDGAPFREGDGGEARLPRRRGRAGCEFLKNFALMGVLRGRAALTVTDDDVIEKSNLSRQFLFRNWNVGHSKSTSAVEAVSAMNAALNVGGAAEPRRADDRGRVRRQLLGGLGRRRQRLGQHQGAPLRRPAVRLLRQASPGVRHARHQVQHADGDSAQDGELRREPRPAGEVRAHVGLHSFPHHPPRA